MTPQDLRNVLEAAMLAAGRALSLDDFLALFEGSAHVPDRAALREALGELASSLDGRSLELVEVASGYRLQVRRDYSPWLAGLFAERPPRYSRALLETLALIAYRQPITRGEIEDVRGVAVSSNIIKTLMEREWIRVLGHREVPGRPALYGTTHAFLDHFGLKGLDGLPPLAEIRDLDQVEPDLFASVTARAAGDAPDEAGGGEPDADTAPGPAGGDGAPADSAAFDLGAADAGIAAIAGAGEDGEPGEAGVPGASRDHGESGEGSGPGESGEPGASRDPGESGEGGEPGDPAEPGKGAESGHPGESGDDGESGESGEGHEPGEPGEGGEAGESGERGESGDDGESGEGDDRDDPATRGAPDRPDAAHGS